MLKFSVATTDEPGQTGRRFPDAGEKTNYETSSDIVARLRSMDSRTPFARGIILEAAAEIERMREAVRTHRREVWGDDEPDHASDMELYRTIG